MANTMMSTSSACCGSSAFATRGAVARAIAPQVAAQPDELAPVRGGRPAVGTSLPPNTSNNCNSNRDNHRMCLVVTLLSIRDPLAMATQYHA